jgi:Domain of unknown function (DUF4149)
MALIFRTVEFLSLGLWLGADVFLSFVVAPGAFAVLGNRDAAGMMVGFALGRMHVIGMILGVVFLLLRLARTQSVGSLAAPVGLCVVLMVILTAASQFTVSKKMAELRGEMGSVQNTAKDNPLRVQFDRLHKASVRYEGAVLLLGLAGMFLLVREVAGK